MQLTDTGALAPDLTVIDGNPTTTSTDVAHHFGKRHDHVLASIRTLIDQLPAERLPIFREASRKVAQPNGGDAEYFEYRMTRDGFTLLAMGYTGRRALAFKLAYIEAFNQMEARLRGNQVSTSPMLTGLMAQLGTLQQQLAQRDAALLGKDQAIMALQGQVIASQGAQIKLLGTVGNLQRRMGAREAVQTIIDMERNGDPRELIALRTGRTATHVRVVLHRARAAGVLPPLAAGDFAPNLVASARAAQAAAQGQLDLAGAHHGG